MSVSAAPHRFVEKTKTKKFRYSHLFQSIHSIGAVSRRVD